MVKCSDDATTRSLRVARERVRENIEQNMISRIIITRGKPATLDVEGLLTADPDAVLIYQGKARLGNATGPVTYTMGEEVQFFSSASCTIPILKRGEPIWAQINDLLLVSEHDDPVMVGKRFRVVDVEVSGLVAASRRLQLVGMQRYGGWVDQAVRHPAYPDVPDEVPPEWRLE